MDPLQSGLPRTANPPVAVSHSPQGLAIRDPGVLSTSQSFTEIEFENRHTAHIGIGKINLFLKADFVIQIALVALVQTSIQREITKYRQKKLSQPVIQDKHC